MLDEFYQEEMKRRNRINPILKFLWVLGILFFIYQMAPTINKRLVFLSFTLCSKRVKKPL